MKLSCRAFFVSLFWAIACLASATEPGPQPLGPSYPGYDVRYGIAPGADLAALVEKPALISMAVEQFKDPVTGESRLYGFGEAHGVYDVALDAVAAVLDDQLGQKAFSPRLLDVREELREGPRIIVYQDIGIVFLGFKVGYRVRSEVYRDELPGGAIGFRARLVDSLEGNLFESMSSWYLEEVLVEGKAMTYARTYTRPGLRKPFIGIAGVVKTFTPVELKSMLNMTVKEARRRSGQK